MAPNPLKCLIVFLSLTPEWVEKPLLMLLFIRFGTFQSNFCARS